MNVVNLPGSYWLFAASISRCHADARDRLRIEARQRLAGGHETHHFPEALLRRSARIFVPERAPGELTVRIVQVAEHADVLRVIRDGHEIERLGALHRLVEERHGLAFGEAQRLLRRHAAGEQHVGVERIARVQVQIAEVAPCDPALGSAATTGLAARRYDGRVTAVRRKLIQFMCCESM